MPTMTHAQPSDPRALLRRAFDAAVQRAQPQRVLAAHLPPPPRGRTLVLGAGKAAGAMAQALDGAWPTGAPLSGCVVTRYGHTPPPPAALAARAPRIAIVEAGHPVPDAASVAAAGRQLALASALGADDLAIVLISGGGSALLTAPAPGLTLQDKQRVSRELLACGAPIDAMNTLRKHLSRIKGGRLALACAPARVLTLAISDVPGDALSLIASGPSVADASTCADALAVATRYAIGLPPPVWAALRAGALETPKPGDAALAGAEARCIATPAQSLDAAAAALRAAGWPVRLLGDALQGEARELGAAHAALALSVARGQGPWPAPCVLLSGGETTVTQRPPPAGQALGQGGRAGEYGLGLTLGLGGAPGIWALAADTDGIDGSSAHAGALVAPDTLARAGALGLDAAQALARHDSHGFFGALGDLLHTGPTHTNVNDFRAVLIADG